jgi:hypothetical protein
MMFYFLAGIIALLAGFVFWLVQDVHKTEALLWSIKDRRDI